MNFRITDDVSEHDVNEIHGMLKEYNLAHREQSKKSRYGCFLKTKTTENWQDWQERYSEIGFAFNSFLSVNNSDGKVSEASYYRPRKAKLSSAAANMLLWILFLFKLRYSTRSMDIRRFSPLRNIRTLRNGIITQKICFDLYSSSA